MMRKCFVFIACLRLRAANPLNQMCIRDRHTPMCVCLQEAHLAPQEHCNMRRDESFLCDVTNIRARRGVAIFFSNTYPARCIPLATPIGACSSNPVSYTHLDVYKRQTYDLPCKLQEEEEQQTMP